MKNLKIAASLIAAAALLAGCDMLESVGSTPEVSISALNDSFDQQGEAVVQVALSSYALEEVTVVLSASGDLASAVTMEKAVKIGVASKTANVTVKIDLSQVKQDSSVKVAISSATGATVGSNKEVSIAVKAGAVAEEAAVVSIESDDEFAADATAHVTLKLNKALSTDVSVELAVKSSEEYATIPADALTFENPVVIKAGQTKAEITVTLNPASLVSGDNYALIAVGNVSGNASAAKDANVTILYTKAVTANLRSDWKVEFTGEYEEEGNVYHGITVSGVSDTQTYYLFVFDKGTIAANFDSTEEFLQYMETYVIGPNIGTENASRIKVGPETWLYYKLPVGGYEAVLAGCSESGHLTGDYASTEFDIEPSEEMKAIYEKYLGEWQLNNPKLTWTISQKVYGASYTIDGVEGLDWPVEAILNDDLQLEIYVQQVADSYSVKASDGNTYDCTVSLYGIDSDPNMGYYWTGDYVIAYGELDDDGNIQLTGGTVSSSGNTYTLGMMIYIAEAKSADKAFSITSNYCGLPNVLINPANIPSEDTPVVSATFDQFIGNWLFGEYPIAVTAAEAENTYIFSIAEGFECLAYFEDGAMTLYDQKFGEEWEHDTYGSCQDFIAGLFSYNGKTYAYYFYNNGQDFDKHTKIFTARLHESGNITLEPGSCEYGDYVGFRYAWVITNPDSQYAGQGNKYVDVSFPEVVVPYIEEEEPSEPASIGLRKVKNRRIETERTFKAMNVYRPYGVIDVL